MRRPILLALLLLTVMLTPTATLAAPSWLPIVPCGSTGQPGCTPCYMFQAFKNTTDLIFEGITGPVAAFMFVVAGGMLLVGADKPDMQQRARRLFLNTVIGVTIIFLSWIGTTFLVKNVAAGSPADDWSHFTCPGYLQEIGATVTVAPAIPPMRVVPPEPQSYTRSTLTDAQMRDFAQSNGEKYPYQNSPSLNRLIDCIYSDPVIAALAKAKPPSSGVQNTGVTTYENDNIVCNYTRGKTNPGGTCEHGKATGGVSCHYGGKTGTNGAEAVDMNAKEQVVTIHGTDKDFQVFANEDTLFCALVNRLLVQNNGNACPDFKDLNWEGDHSHISTKTCDSDGKGITSLRGMKVPDCANSFRLPQ